MHKTYINSVSHLLNATTNPNLSNQGRNNLLPSDTIYLYQQLERIFATSAIDCLYQNVIYTKGTYYSLVDQGTLNILSDFMNLPNVFTRQYILQMCIDTLTKHFDYSFKSESFFTKLSESPQALGFISKESNFFNQQGRLSIWQYQYSNFIKYLTYFLFPIYENYFFSIIWNSIAQSLPDASNAEIILHIYHLFQQYLNDEETLATLFSTEKIILSSVYQKDYLLKEEHIIRPNLHNPENLDNMDAYVYQNCLAAHSLINKSEPSSDFLDLSMFKRFDSDAAIKIQSLFIKGLIS